MNYLNLIKDDKINTFQNHNTIPQSGIVMRFIIDHGPGIGPLEIITLYKSGLPTYQWFYKYFDFPRDKEKFDKIEALQKYIANYKEEHLTVYETNGILDEYLHTRISQNWLSFSIKPNEHYPMTESKSLHFKTVILQLYNGSAKTEVSWINKLPMHLYDSVNSLYENLLLVKTDARKAVMQKADINLQEIDVLG